MDRLELIEKIVGVLGKGVQLRKTDAGTLQKSEIRYAKGTAANNPPVPSIDGVRTLLEELIAESVARARADVRSAMLRSPLFLTLMREAEKDPMVQRVLIESILEAERTAGGPEQPEAPIAGIYDTDTAAFEAAQKRGRQLDAARELVKKPVRDISDYRVAKEMASQVLAAAQAIADNLAAGKPDVPASTVAKMIAGTKPDREPMVDFGLKKSTTDATPVDVRDLGKPRRMNQSEVLR